MRRLGTFLITTLVVVACGGSESNAPAGASPPEGTGGQDAGVDATSGPPIVPPDPKEACPAGFAAPAAGDNTGFTVANQARAFHMLVPPASFTGPRPILFAFHGTSETGIKFVTRAKLADFSAKGFIVIAPNAVGNGTIWPVWDAMRTPTGESAPNPDVELFDKLLSCTAAHFQVDATRVFVTGHSAGGIFTNRLLRTRSNVLAGGIPASGVFDLTSGNNKAALEDMLVVVTWGGDNDTYKGTTPNGVSVPAFSFVEQASLATKYYAAQPNVTHVRCRGNDLGHAWLPLNAWFADLMLARPKGSKKDGFTMPPIPNGAAAACETSPYDLAPLTQVTCGTSTRAGCKEACQLFADCAVENRTVGPTMYPQLQKIGFTQTSCTGCVQRCEQGATTATDAEVLSCFSTKQAGAQCAGGIEGAFPLFEGVNQCCAGKKATSNLCKDLCTTLLESGTAAAFFPACK